MSLRARALAQPENVDRFGKYTLLDCIAESHMSRLYRARVKFGELNRLVVVKTLHPASLDDPKNKKLFFREIEISQALQHPNIVQIFDFGESEGDPFIVMEWVHGRNLKQLMAAVNSASQKLPLSAVTWIMLEAVKALGYAHSFTDKLTGAKLSIIHGDLSPHNLMLSFDGVLKLIDFGIARVITEDSHTLTDTIRGKTGYLSPEQLSGAGPSPRSDLFSLGCIFWELIFGKRLFEGKTDFITLEMIKNSDDVVIAALNRTSGIPMELQEILTKLLRSDPELRYASAEELQYDLVKFALRLPNRCSTKSIIDLLGVFFGAEIADERAKLIALAASTPQHQPISSSKAIATASATQSLPELDLGEAEPKTTQKSKPLRERASKVKVPSPELELCQNTGDIKKKKTRTRRHRSVEEVLGLNVPVELEMREIPYQEPEPDLEVEPKGKLAKLKPGSWVGTCATIAGAVLFILMAGTVSKVLAKMNLEEKAARALVEVKKLVSQENRP